MEITRPGGTSASHPSPELHGPSTSAGDNWRVTVIRHHPSKSLYLTFPACFNWVADSRNLLILGMHNPPTIPAFGGWMEGEGMWANGTSMKGSPLDIHSHCTCLCRKQAACISKGTLVKGTNWVRAPPRPLSHTR
jgi:hypothetical protein